MNRRAFSICTALFAVSSVLIGAGNSRRPTLYIVHSVSCPPCAAFDQDWLTDPQFKAALCSRFDVRSLSWEDSKARQYAQRIGVRSLPSYVVQLPDGRWQPPVVGYRVDFTVAERKADLLQRLGVPWPRGDVTPPANNGPVDRPTQKPESPGYDMLRDYADKQRRMGEEIGDLHAGLNRANSTARDAVSAIEKLREELALQNAGRPAAPQSEPAAADRPDPAPPHRESRTGPEGRATPEPETRPAASDPETGATPEPSRPAASSAASTPPRNDQPAPPATPAHAAELSPPTLNIHPAAGPTTPTDNTEGVVGPLLRVGLGAAAMYFGLPVGAGAVAASAVTWLVMRRRKRRREPASTGATFQQPAAQPAAGPLPRKFDEALEVLRLAEREGRVPVHEALRGVLADDELEQLIATGSTDAVRQFARELKARIAERFANVAPISQQPTRF